MKNVLLLSALLMMSLPALADEDAVSEATVASHSYDPKKEDCKCLQPKKEVRPLDNERADLQVVNWITSDAAGAPPPIGGTGTAK